MTEEKIPEQRSLWKRFCRWCRWAWFDPILDEWRLWAILTVVIGSITTVIGVPAVLIDAVGGMDGQYRGYAFAVQDMDNFTWDSTVVFLKTSPQTTKYDTVLCVTDPVLKEKLIKAARETAPVTVSYRNDLFLWRWKCNGGESIVTAVETP